MWHAVERGMLLSVARARVQHDKGMWAYREGSIHEGAA